MIPVVIPYYKNKDQLDRCLSHLKQQSMPVEVFIRDNSEDNIYFTAAVNEGIRHFLAGPARYIIILNQDMYLEPLAVEEMVQFMNCNPACGIGSPLQLYYKQHDYVIWAGCFEAFPIGKHQHGPLENFGNDQPVCWANGACMILRKSMIQEIGLLDKNLVFIGSDSDYSFTARSRGWQVWRIAAARGIHEHGASGHSGNPEIELRKIRDMLYFSKKWLNGSLYRALSYEGPQLSPEKVDDIVNRLEAAKLEVAQQISLQKQK